jgi:hypothetical protein
MITLSTAPSPSADFLSRSQKLGAQIDITCPDARYLCINDNIKLIWNFPAGSSEYLPEKALDPITNHSPADFSGDGDSHPMVAKSVFTAE